MQWENIKAIIKRSPLVFGCFCIIWLLTNGLFYTLSIWDVGLLTVIARAYIVFIYTPFGIEKPIQIFLAARMAKLITSLFNNRSNKFLDYSAYTAKR